MSSKLGVSRHLSVGRENPAVHSATELGHHASKSAPDTKPATVRRRQTSLGLRASQVAAPATNSIDDVIEDVTGDSTTSPFDLDGWLHYENCVSESVAEAETSGASHHTSSTEASTATTSSATAACSVQLTAEHKHIIVATWPTLKRYMTSPSSDDVTSATMGGATRIFMRIFELSPGIKRVFGFHADSNPEEILADGRLKEHAGRFTDAIGSAADNLDRLETHVAQAFINLGKRHIDFSNIDEGHFDVFCGAFMYVCRQALLEHLTLEVSTAWRRLFDFLLQQLKCGYRLAASHQAAMCEQHAEQETSG